ncbi:MAG: Crp/Fnr family transcriptional regulator [Clostridia bacterium]|nr:Crp/Fnr family transcriptional regulator [Clostridia bacterium]
MEKYMGVLRKCPLFAGISEKDLLKMLTCMGARVELFDKKYTIITEGNPAKYIGVVLSGKAQIIQVDYYGNRSILTEVESGDVFGEAFACAEVQSIPITVIASESSEIMLVECAHILHTCSNNCGFHQRLIYNLMKDLATKTILFHQKIEIISKRSTREKLLTYLSFYAKKVGRNQFEIPYDRQELADYLEVDRSGLSAEISKLRNEGILESEKKWFALLE